VSGPRCGPGLSVPGTKRQGDGGLPRVVAFDVDGTITRRDCVVPFVRRVAGTARLASRLLRRPAELAHAVAARDRDALKAAGARAAFRGEYVDRVESAGVAFARATIRTNLRGDVVTALRTHLADGDTVVWVSASFEVYLQPMASHLGVGDVLGTRLADDGDGRLTGELVGANCRGAEKVRRLHDCLDQHAGGRSHVHLTAYGDSSGDRELLVDADTAIWVGRGSMPASWTVK